MSLLVSNGLGTVGVPYPACLAFLITSVVPGDRQITVNLTSDPILDGPGLDPSYYTITAISGVAVTVTAVNVSGSSLILTTTRQTDAGSYSLGMPFAGIIDINTNPFNGPFTNAFTGVGITLAIIMAKSFDARTLDVIFNEGVTEATASIAANYAISPTLTVSKAVKITDSVYRLTTSRQTADVTYTVTASNINSL